MAVSNNHGLREAQPSSLTAGLLLAHRERKWHPRWRFGPTNMPIRAYLDGHAVFEPDAINAMSRALEEVCTALQLADGQGKDREIIATRIIDLARNGVVDAAALRDRVLAETRAMRSL